METRREYGEIFKTSKEKPYQSRTFYSQGTILHKQAKTKQITKPKTQTTKPKHKKTNINQK